MEEDERITVGKLIRNLRAYEEDFEVDFQGLRFLRLKQRAPKLVQVEFAQQISRDGKTGDWVVSDPP